MKNAITLTILLSLLSFASVSTAESNSNDPFCSTAPAELLSALDGTWSIYQGPGQAIGGFAVPLPPSSTTVQLKYDKAEGYSLMSGYDDSMLMVPSGPNQVQAAVDFLDGAAAKKKLKIGSGCDFFSLPIILGTNVYTLYEGPGQSKKNSIAIQFNKNLILYCPEGGSDPKMGPLLVTKGELVKGSKSAKDGAYKIESETCKPPKEIPAPKPGTMSMTIAVKFQSPNSGSGMLHFEGEKNGYHFAAQAPITMTRSS